EGDAATVVWRAVFPPNCTVSAHTHNADYIELILEGSQKVGRTWYGPGDIRVVDGGTVYGPLVTGPDGVTVLVIFNGADVEARPPVHGGPITVTVDEPVGASSAAVQQ